MAQLAEQLTCNQQVFGSSPNIGFILTTAITTANRGGDCPIWEVTQVAKGGRL